MTEQAYGYNKTRLCDMSQEPTLLQAIEIILRDATKPLSDKEILKGIQTRELVITSSKTPITAVRARISEDIKKKGENSVFMRVGPGKYTIRETSEEEEYFPPPYEKQYPSDKESRVLVFPATFLDNLGHFHGVRRDFQRYCRILDRVENPAGAFFMSRDAAEQDFEHKQIVSYVIVKYKNAVLRQTRGARTSVSSYLKDRYSIGFGGHVEYRDDDLPLFSKDFGYTKSVYRELYELDFGQKLCIIAKPVCADRPGKEQICG